MNAVKPPPPVRVNMSTTTDTRTPVRTGRDRIIPGPQHELQLDTERAYPLSSWVLENYVKPILLEDSIELIKDLLGKFVNWYEEESIYYNELIEECCEREELDKVENFNGQITALNSSFREQIHLILLHCDELIAREERILSEMNERFAEDDNIEHSPNGQTDEQSDEESLETANNAFLPRSNVISHQDEADSYSLNGSTEDDGGVEPPELNDDPFLSRSDIESSDENEDDDMTEMSSLISDIKRRIEELRNSLDVDETDSDSSNDLTESEPEEPPETEDNTSLSRLDVETHNEVIIETTRGKSDQIIDEETVESYEAFSYVSGKRITGEGRKRYNENDENEHSSNCFTDEQSEEEWLVTVNEADGISHKNGRDSSHSIETNRRLSGGQNGQLVKIIENGKDLTESDQVINYLETAELNKTVPDILEEQTMGIEFGPDQNIHLFKYDEKGRNDRNYETNLTNGRHNKSELKAPEAVKKPYPPPSDLVSHDKVTEDVSEVKTINEDRSAESVGQSSGIILRFKPQEIKRVKPKVKYRNHRQYETDQILTNKSEDNAVWMQEVFK